MALEPSRLSDFRLLGPLGSGATARVFEAVQLATNRVVAVKILQNDDADMVDELRERFAREALMLAEVRSRYVGQILGFGFERGQPFLVLERLVGTTLDALVKRDGPVLLVRMLPWITHLLLGLRDCHASHVIHRDIKPANIFLQQMGDAEPIAKLIDFGVARIVQAGNPTGLTSTQHLLGSVGYMAPEQFVDAKGVGPSADLYAVGVVIFRCLTGKLPFVSKSFEAVMQMKANLQQPLISSVPNAPNFPALDWFVAKASARLPSERFHSAREMLESWQLVVRDIEASMVVRRISSIPAPDSEIPIDFFDEAGDTAELNISMVAPLSTNPLSIEGVPSTLPHRGAPSADRMAITTETRSSEVIVEQPKPANALTLMGTTWDDILTAGGAPQAPANFMNETLRLGTLAADLEPGSVNAVTRESPHILAPDSDRMTASALERLDAVWADDEPEPPTQPHPNLRQLVDEELAISRRQRKEK